MFIPKHNVDTAAYPPMVIELKWHQTAETAIRQIRDRNYPEKLKNYEKILLVGINYDKDSKKHECMIEEYKTN